MTQVKPQNDMLIGKDTWNNMKALHICGKTKNYLSLFCFTDGSAESNA